MLYAKPANILMLYDNNQIKKSYSGHWCSCVRLHQLKMRNRKDYEKPGIAQFDAVPGFFAMLLFCEYDTKNEFLK